MNNRTNVVTVDCINDKGHSNYIYLIILSKLTGYVYVCHGPTTTTTQSTRLTSVVCKNKNSLIFVDSGIKYYKCSEWG